MIEILEMFKYDACMFIILVLFFGMGISSILRGIASVIHGVPPTQCKFPDEISEDLEDD